MQSLPTRNLFVGLLSMLASYYSLPNIIISQAAARLPQMTRAPIKSILFLANRNALPLPTDIRAGGWEGAASLAPTETGKYIIFRAKASSRTNAHQTTVAIGAPGRTAILPPPKVVRYA